MEYIGRGETVSARLSSVGGEILSRFFLNTTYHFFATRLDPSTPLNLSTINDEFDFHPPRIFVGEGKKAAVCRQNICRWMKGEDSRRPLSSALPPFSLSLFPRYPFRFHVSPLSSFFPKCSQSPSLGILFPDFSSSPPVCPEELPVSDTRLLFNYYSSSLFSLTFLRINDDLLDCNP